MMTAIQRGRAGARCLCRIAIAATMLALPGEGRAAPLDAFIAALYRPFQGDNVELSPDGRHLAYTRNEKDGLCLYLMNIYDGRKVRLVVEEDREVPFAREKAPARLRFLRWASPTRVVFAVTEYYSGVRWHAPVFAADADGGNAKKLADADDFALTSMPRFNAEGVIIAPPRVIPRRTVLHGLRPGQPHLLQIEALGRPLGRERDATAVPTVLFEVDVRTGKINPVAEGFGDGRYCYDQNGAPRIHYVQPPRSLERHFEHLWPGAWSAPRNLNTVLGASEFTLTAANYYGHRSYPLGFGHDPDVLYYASNVGRDTFGVYAVNLKTRQRLDLAVEDPRYDLASLEPAYPGGTLVHDVHRRQLVGVRALGAELMTVWLDPELALVQRELEEKFPRRAVVVDDWSEARDRFLVRVTGGVDPGRYHVYLRPQNLLTEVLPRAPWLRHEDLHEARTFAFDTPEGVHLSGYLTFPRRPRLNPPPLVIDFQAGPLGRERPGFSRQAQVLATMGFVVARINVRGTSGFGVRHRAIVPGGFDRVRVEDTLAAVDWIGRHFPVDRQRVGLIGTGFGGYVALRALQLAPDRFRCAVAIQAPVDPRRWLEPPLTAASAFYTPPVNFHREVQADAWEQAVEGGAGRPLLEAVDALTNPILLVVDPPRDREIAAQNATLRARLKRADRPPGYVEAGAGFAHELPGDKARVYREIHEFFNLHLYDYKVKVGETKEVR